MTGKDDSVPYEPLPYNNYPHQNVVVLLPTYHHHHRRRSTTTSCLLTALILLLFLTSAAFFLYPSDPEVRLIRVGINHIGIRVNPKPVLDLSFSVRVQVRNRDFFSLSYDSLAVAVGYRGRQLGFVSSSDGGRIRARGSSYVDAVLTVDGFEVIYDAFYLLQDIAKGVIPFDTETRVDGKLGLFFFDVPLKATVSCEVYVNINKQTIVRQNCYPESLGDTLAQSADIGAEENADVGAEVNTDIGAEDT
ncbi:uncharacterized protein LOC130738954 [Lotus japonicus]|uniref:uncharacterized protein LOC130738954 n=1 Tax=Lotus japonicus TaxID=34305 RepID=UPI00258E8009|nr:uncharacterized protein LOC130738954 [Lotus japonicus]